MPWRRSIRTGAARLLVPAVAAIAVAACGGDDASSPHLSPAAELGREVSATRGCAACHGADGGGGVGPAWTGLYGSEVELADGTTAVADEAYLARAITDPRAEFTAGFQVAMPDNELTDEDIDAVIAYIEALRE